MNRRSFVKISGLGTMSYLVGDNLLASYREGMPSVLININPPNLHVRHGLFNLQSNNEGANGFYIQRDIFPPTGLAEISDNRMVSLKISNNGVESFGVLHRKMLKSNSSKLYALELSKNNSTHINTESPCLIFSEYSDFMINEITIKNNQALIQYTNTELIINSKSDQTILVYHI